jgi:hypothetical protein
VRSPGAKGVGRTTGAGSIAASVAGVCLAASVSGRHLTGWTTPARAREQRYLPAMVISVFRRRLREGKTLEDFREAWEAEHGFGVPTRVFNSVCLEDNREILTVAFARVEADSLAAATASVAEQEAVRHSRIDEVIESTALRAFYEIRCEHDLSAQPRAESLDSPQSLLAALA